MRRTTSAVTLALLVALSGNQTAQAGILGPAQPRFLDHKQTVTDLKQIGKSSRKWTWALIGAAVGTGTVLALEASRPKLRHGQSRGPILVLTVERH